MRNHKLRALFTICIVLGWFCFFLIKINRHGECKYFKFIRINVTTVYFYSLSFINKKCIDKKNRK